MTKRAVMANRMYARRTNRLCEFGFPISIECHELYIEQQDEPHDVIETQLCCEAHAA